MEFSVQILCELNEDVLLIQRRGKISKEELSVAAVFIETCENSTNHSNDIETFQNFFPHRNKFYIFFKKGMENIFGFI